MAASLDEFVASLEHEDATANHGFVDHIEQYIPIYDAARLRGLDPHQRQMLRREWAEIWQQGAGIIAITGFYADTKVVDAMSQVMNRLLHREHGEKHTNGDHFASAGKNKRLWNALEKVAVEDPQAFIDYYQNPLLGDACEAWLGPGYQVTAQVNLVPPGSHAQAPHRDYHLGFQPDSEVQRYPLHSQKMSAYLTLQGAVAHVDMPVESGPTRVLPHSQRYPLGYQLYRQHDFQSYFETHAVQLPLALGDAMFFNPALMHAAGANHSRSVQRLANLLQISSPFARAMEIIDHDRIQLACYQLLTQSRLTDDAMQTLATVISDNYPFPTNLDRDIPDGNLTPTSSRDLLCEALAQNWEKSRFQQALQDYRWRRRSA